MGKVELVITTYEYKNPGENYTKTGITLSLGGKELPQKQFNNPHLLDEAIWFIGDRRYESIDGETLFWLLAEEYEELSDYECWDWDFGPNQLVFQLKPSAEGRERFRVYRLEAELEKTKKELEEMTRKYDKKVSDAGWEHHERWAGQDFGPRLVVRREDF